MENDKILKLAMDAGQIMLSSGAETYRIEDTMERILKNFHLQSIDSVVTTTGIFSTIVDTDGNVSTMVRRISKRTINLERISMVNEISRNLSEGKIDMDKAIEEIEKVNNHPPYKSISKIIASGVCCSCFSYIFGGDLTDFISAFAAGLILYTFIIFANNKNISGFIINILGGAIVSFVVLLMASLGIGNNPDQAIIGSIMPLVPGVGLTNAVRDVMTGDYLSGTSRIMDALLVSVCIATGVGLTLGIWLYAQGAL